MTKQARRFTKAPWCRWIRTKDLPFDAITPGIFPPPPASPLERGKSATHPPPRPLRAENRRQTPRARPSSAENPRHDPPEPAKGEKRATPNSEQVDNQPLGSVRQEPNAAPHFWRDFARSLGSTRGLLFRLVLVVVALSSVLKFLSELYPAREWLLIRRLANQMVLGYCDSVWLLAIHAGFKGRKAARVLPSFLRTAPIGLILCASSSLQRQAPQIGLCALLLMVLPARIIEGKSLPSSLRSAVEAFRKHPGVCAAATLLCMGVLWLVKLLNATATDRLHAHLQSVPYQEQSFTLDGPTALYGLGVCTLALSALARMLIVPVSYWLYQGNRRRSI